MQGIDIAEKLFNEYGIKMLKSFTELFPRVAAGVVGEGSECLFYDDEISRDHDFDAGFCIWLTEEDEEKFGFELSRAYSKLPKEFCGVKRQILSPAGGDRRGVSSIGAFYRKFTGEEGAPSNLLRWLSLPSHSLLAASNGKVFLDNYGKFSEIREIIKRGYPEDVKRKKLAANLALMAQSGQYNYERCVRRGETGAAQLAAYEFVRRAISAIYLVNDKYEPFYKWAFRGMRNLPSLSELEIPLISLIETDNGKRRAEQKLEIIEGINAEIVKTLKAKGLSIASGEGLDAHAFSVTDGIKDATLRNLHLMEGI